MMPLLLIKAYHLSNILDYLHTHIHVSTTTTATIGIWVRLRANLYLLLQHHKLCGCFRTSSYFNVLFVLLWDNYILKVNSFWGILRLYVAACEIYMHVRDHYEIYCETVFGGMEITKSEKFILEVILLNIGITDNNTVWQKPSSLRLAHTRS